MFTCWLYYHIQKPLPCHPKLLWMSLWGVVMCVVDSWERDFPDFRVKGLNLDFWELMGRENEPFLFFYFVSRCDLFGCCFYLLNHSFEYSKFLNFHYPIYLSRMPLTSSFILLKKLIRQTLETTSQIPFQVSSSSLSTGFNALLAKFLTTHILKTIFLWAYRCTKRLTKVVLLNPCLFLYRFQCIGSLTLCGCGMQSS
jgi:hypothetical protein